MKIYKVTINNKDYITTQPPMFVPGFVLLTLNERKTITILANTITALEWKFIDKKNPNYNILLAKVTIDK